MNLDRFGYGRPDPQQARVVCECDDCAGEIYYGQRIWRVGHNRYCSKDCFMQAFGASVIIAGEDDE